MRRQLTLAIFVVLTLTAGAEAQRIQVEAQGQAFAGDPVPILVEVSGFQDPKRHGYPEITFRDPQGYELQRSQNPPAEGYFMEIRNGRRTSRITLTYEYIFTAPRKGTYQVGPFEARQGNLRAVSDPLLLGVESVTESDALKIRLILPEKPVTIGERIDVTLEWWFTLDPDDFGGRYRLTVPLFDQETAFHFVDPEFDRRREQVLRMNGGRIALPYDAERRTLDGKSYTVVSIRRTMVPRQAGSYEIAPATVAVDEVLSWRRPSRRIFFDNPVPDRVRKHRARDLERTLTVNPVPQKNRPDSFAGAVGESFSLTVDADATVLRVGDPLTLTIELRGDGNIEEAGLPDLTGEEGLSPELFRIPDTRVGGILREDGVKEFRITLRVKSERASEIPPLAYSWYDPSRDAFETSRSQPIALSVRGSAPVVGAEDVVNRSRGEDREPVRDETPTPELERMRRSNLVLTGADLSLVTDTGRLLRRGAPDPASPPIRAALYGVPMALLGLALLARRRAAVDPAVRNRRRLLRREYDGIRRLAGQPRTEAARELAARLRTMRRECPDVAESELEALLARCDALAYDPTGSASTPLEPALHEEGLRLARQIVEACP